MSTRSKTLDPDPQFTVGRGDMVFPDRDFPDRPPQGPMPRRSSRAAISAVVVVALIAGAGALYYYKSKSGSPVTAAAPPAVTVPSAAQSRPPIQYPIEKTPGAETTQSSPLPALDDSDALARSAIATILNSDALTRILVPEGIVRHIVATVDALPRKTIATQVLPVRPASGTFATTTAAQGTSIAPDNATRYAIYLGAAEAIDSRRLAGFYVRLYPLFQQAYVDLGYPSGYFNDRLIAVIDHLLASPEPVPPIYLSQSKVMYEFADPSLEDLSAGQKLLMRSGLDNERRIKAKLRDIRKALVAEPPPS
jgi:DUF3014 family protein